MIKRFLPWLRWIVPLAAAFFIGRVIWLQWTRVREFDWTFDPRFLVLSFVATSSWFFVRGYVWRALVADFGWSLPYREAVRIFALAELSRYVPGKIWQYVSRVYLAGRWGVPAPAALTSALMDLLLMALASVPFALWRLPDVLPALGRTQQVVFVAFPFAAIAMLHPAVLNRLGARVVPLLKMDFTPVRTGFSRIVILWVLCLLLWIAFGTGFVLFARSLAPISLAQGPAMIGNYAVSWLMGMIAPFAPGGIVVREGILGLLLGKILPLGTALLVAVLSRLWLILLELFWAGVLQLYGRVNPPLDAPATRR